MKSIPASKGYVILVDAADYDALSKFKWYAHRGGSRWGTPEYRPARREPVAPRNVHFLVHAIAGKAPTGLVIDHINGNPFDNRRENLRLCTNAENCRNQRRPRKLDGAGKGVRWYKGAWEALIGYDSKLFRLGRYTVLLEAELAYDAAALHLHGEYACLNHPEVATEPCSPEQLVDRQHHAPRRDRNETIIALHHSGLYAAKIAEATGIHPSTVRNVLNARGLSRGRGRPRKVAA